MSGTVILPQPYTVMAKKLSEIKIAAPVLESGFSNEEIDRAQEVAEQILGDTDGKEMVAFEMLKLAKDKNYAGMLDIAEEMVTGNDVVTGSDNKIYHLSTLWGERALKGARARKVLRILAFTDARLYQSVATRDIAGTISMIIGLTSSDAFPFLLGYAYAPDDEDYDMDMAEEYGNAISDTMSLFQQVGVLLSFFSVISLLRKFLGGLASSSQ
jgi:hypothetical protein